MKPYIYFPLFILLLTCCKSNNPTHNSVTKYSDVASFANGKVKTYEIRTFTGGYENGDILSFYD